MAHDVWRPTRFKRFLRRVESSSTRPSEIQTDAGRAFVKCLGNPEGPHTLICEWIGTRIASLIGLQTLDFSILSLDADDVPFDGGHEKPGPCFATRYELGFPWSGHSKQLSELANPSDLAKLVVLDTYLLNRDRRSPAGTRRNKDNVFLSQEREPVGKLCLLAIDHTHAISNGRRLDASLGYIDRTKNRGIFGLFGPFARYLTDEVVRNGIDGLKHLSDRQIESIIKEIPNEWELEQPGADGLRSFLKYRRDFLVDNLFELLSLEAGKQMTTQEETEE